MGTAGANGSNVRVRSWFYQRLPIANHRRADGSPLGANCLFASGEVQWRPYSQIELGCYIPDGDFLMFYKRSIE